MTLVFETYGTRHDDHRSGYFGADNRGIYLALHRPITKGAHLLRAERPGVLPRAA